MLLYEESKNRPRIDTDETRTRLVAESNPCFIRVNLWLKTWRWLYSMYSMCSVTSVFSCSNILTALIKYMSMIVALVFAGGFGERGYVLLGEKAFEFVTAFDVFRNQNRILGMLGEYLLQIG